MNNFEDRLIGCLSLAITLGVINGRPMLCDFESLAQFLEVFILELSSIVSNDRGWYTISADDVVFDKKCYSFSISNCERYYLYPLREIIYSRDNELMSIRGGWVDLSYQVEGSLLK